MESEEIKIKQNMFVKYYDPAVSKYAMILAKGYVKSRYKTIHFDRDAITCKD